MGPFQESSDQAPQAYAASEAPRRPALRHAGRSLGAAEAQVLGEGLFLLGLIISCSGSIGYVYMHIIYIYT